MLFSGTLRYNLDPFDDFDDQQLWSALEQVRQRVRGRKRGSGESCTAVSMATDSLARNRPREVPCPLGLAALPIAFPHPPDTFLSRLPGNPGAAEVGSGGAGGRSGGCGDRGRSQL